MSRKTTKTDETGDRRIAEMPQGASRDDDPQTDEEFLEEVKSEVREAGDLYGSDMARDERAIREQRANNPRPNEDH